VAAITGTTYHDVIWTRYLRDINRDFVLNDACVYSQRITGEADVLNVVDMAVRSAIGSRGRQLTRSRSTSNPASGSCCPGST
jgi:pyruvate dehydrogenase (quinone)